MEQIQLNNGLVVPSVGYGTFPLKNELLEASKNAYIAGYRLFDTSDNYYNEEYLGVVLKNNPDMKTESIVISKFSQPERTKELKKCFYESKEKLGKIDIYLLHWPYPYLWKKQWRMMEDLYINEEVKGIGVCNFEIDKLQQLLKICKIKPVINQIERHPLFQQQTIVDYCKENRIQIMSYAPMARQDKELYAADNLKSISKKYNKTISQVIMRWNVETGTIPIPASKSKSHIYENYDIDGFTLIDDEIEAINSLDKGKRIRYDPKKRFSYKKKVIYFINNLRL